MFKSVLPMTFVLNSWHHKQSHRQSQRGYKAIDKAEESRRQAEKLAVKERDPPSV
jgi:hypothetical protein